VLLTNEGRSSGVAETAKAAGLKVHAWTVRRENAFLPPAFRSAEGESAPGDLAGLVGLLDMIGVDAIFTDNVAQSVAAMEGR
jgi:glycerophosphoryl diester phosphodiesterase